MINYKIISLVRTKCTLINISHAHNSHFSERQLINNMIKLPHTSQCITSITSSYYRKSSFF